MKAKINSMEQECKMEEAQLKLEGILKIASAFVPKHQMHIF